jgi:hypothetical protein
MPRGANFPSPASGLHLFVQPAYHQLRAPIDSPSRSRTSFCPSDRHRPRVPALFERTFPYLCIRHPHPGRQPERGSGSRGCEELQPTSDCRRAAQRLAHDHVKRVERPREGRCSMTIRIAFPRLRCRRDLPAPPLLITDFALIARYLMGSPRSQRVLSEETVDAPRPSSATYMRRQDKNAGRVPLFPYSTKNRAGTGAGKYASALPEESRSSRHTKARAS